MSDINMIPIFDEDENAINITPSKYCHTKTNLQLHTGEYIQYSSTLSLSIFQYKIPTVVAN